MALNTALCKTLGVSWLAFMGAGLLMSRVLPIPELTLLIDHSYCPDAQWQPVAHAYGQIYRQHQRRQIRIKQVILFNPLGSELGSPKFLIGFLGRQVRCTSAGAGV
ncbi:hypothetical protein IQ254_14300 [Nodosilinea sp. LEGE 07088]|uniref:hypothetical protein n=1 Tax=Nodosilinea sp. LEGE 07088 TaxID=2777968 RepID=UPI00187FF3D5|nr:hypothetical protein [Nodosilinea sp. LEGE 07088]MBE9138344.1 hypothetical protein [Nodosilinea sp. LEGE 07088]